MRRAQWFGTRWLGVGLAAVLAVVTITLALTGRLALYINPDSTWFAVSMSVVALVGAIASFALPLGAEADHGHDHGDHGAHDDHHGAHDDDAGHHVRHPASVAATVVGGVAASGVVVLTLVLPPASLSAELAMSRDVGATPLFAGADAVTLAATGDTSSFGVGEWATVFATATNPDAFDGDPIELTGFVTPGEGDAFDLTRLVITHCVIDAQPASIPVGGQGIPETGQWVTVTGTVRSTSDGRLEIDADTVEPIDEPEDPYEY
ncbi:TIGR03943 family putative permease subunit [Microbacterium sp. SSM24]|uniref:TIGR03943 family putative permease subunit n=1 Tax=Microbacterium sp. SSM24 TaxID=2991714 RepID=UPI002227D08E|nr:TIGR03943 family protein [Microbacterium sp. SSM24]MCW3493028.1 TIGR03943 family protein [Microbacterium sp. SSM24]